jgi:glutaminyl-peptide cyclotransferase
MKKIPPIVILALITACKSNESPDVLPAQPNSHEIGYEILRTYLHDTTSFTEGLFWCNGFLYESTGLEGKTSIQKIDLKNGTVIQRRNENDKKIFGEGIACIDNKLYQLTWKNKIVNAYDLSNFKKQKQLVWPAKEAWGITNNQTRLIASDGSDKIYFVNPSSFTVDTTLAVFDQYGPVGNINELEFVNGFIYANIWQTDNIVKISSQTGEVVGKIDLSSVLLKAGISYPADRMDVLNGIAYNPQNTHFYITGKYWPCIIEIKIE